jgi:peptidoglycan/LPS O-acetylase OafA/YrhL
MTFRPDIEGLRALAIVLVVMCHAHVPGLAGGFVGVDVFFVISGYLITGLLIDEVRRTGRIDLWRFYARRIRRLMPALLLMVLVVVAFATWLLPKPRLATQLDDAAWTVVWLANFDQALSRMDYFGTAREQSLFLHAWSLGVEEQFYLVWPLAMLLLVRRFPDAFRARVIALSVFVAAGFALALLESARDPLAAYFLPHVRAWQFGVGALAFVVTSRAVVPGPAATALGLAGLATVVGSALTIDYDTAYPGWAALGPTLGTAALLAAGASGAAGPVTRILASRPAVFLGAVSYAWYLWHWPLISLAVLWWPHSLGRVGAAAVALLLAMLSFRLVEAPLRVQPLPDPRRAMLAGGALSLLLFALLYHGSASLGTQSRTLPASTEPGLLAFADLYAAGCDDWYHSDQLVPCRFDAPSALADRTVVIIGDSIGMQWFPALDRSFRGNGWNVVALTKSACAIVDEPFHYERIRRRYVECESWRQRAIDYVRETRPDLVVIGSSGSYRFDLDQWEAGSVRVLEQLRRGAPRVVVIAPTPTIRFDPATCLHRAGPECAVAFEDARWRVAEQGLQRAVARVEGTELLDLNAIACPDGTCSVLVDGLLAFRDEQHLAAEYVDRRHTDIDAVLRTVVDLQARDRAEKAGRE